MWHIYTLEYYSAMKRNEMELCVVRWMDLDRVCHTECSKSEREKQIQYANTYIWNLRGKKSHEELSGKTGIKTQTY